MKYGEYTIMINISTSDSVSVVNIPSNSKSSVLEVAKGE